MGDTYFCILASMGLKAMQLFLTSISPGPGIGIFASPRTTGALAAWIQDAWLDILRYGCLVWSNIALLLCTGTTDIYI